MKAVAIVCIAVFGFAIVTEANPCENVREGEELLYTNEENCGTYWQCDHQKPVLRDCPDGLHFNNITKQCDFPQFACCLPGLCESTVTTTKPVEPTSRPTTPPSRPTTEAPRCEDCTGPAKPEPCGPGVPLWATTCHDCLLDRYYRCHECGWILTFCPPCEHWDCETSRCVPDAA